jgi:AcrR family transcriptional regulator
MRTISETGPFQLHRRGDAQSVHRGDRTGALRSDTLPKVTLDSTSIRARQARAVRNDQRILQAAREVFIEQGPSAPTAEIARRAGVGIAALFRRYPTKEELMRQMSIAGMRQMIAAAEAAVREPDAWHGFSEFMRRCLAEGGGGLISLAGTFRASEEQLAIGEQLRRALDALVRRARSDGGLRAEVTASDIYLLLGDIRLEHPTDPRRTPKLRRRHLALVLDGMRASSASDRLPGPPAAWSDFRQRWSGSLSPARGGEPRD